MADRWIVTGYQFVMHATLQAAQFEFDRLSARFPKKPFKLLRVKSTLKASPDKVAMGEEIAALRTRIADLEADLAVANGGIPE